jgi:DinB superfamily
MSEGQRLAAKLKTARDRLLVGAQHVSEGDSPWRPAPGGGAEIASSAPAAGIPPGEWSVVEILSHLVDVDRHWLREALAIRDDSDHVFVHFDDERWKEDPPTPEKNRWKASWPASPSLTPR